MRTCSFPRANTAARPPEQEMPRKSARRTSFLEFWQRAVPPLGVADGERHDARACAVLTAEQSQHGPRGMGLLASDVPAQPMHRSPAHALLWEQTVWAGQAALSSANLEDASPVGH